ncbi:hypothetical protein TPHA_0I01560 [Tetrapisispora phaffii CBS 4417]|uniref:Peroxisomal membrane protein PEX25 n=1 Tax=Tetrapisispora phaffii (strain ATCC 24235 / CBS 4417 / NBRC 1672 / NRRL Y-8282 / UCD 70-5) TaxID=1071381 RepID=G8BXN4_TETPH|nr:hypothetical protein TPHA_0I01560 [Tetrapisispora phaffii CBS 4417]CCE64662.1 hypothetical protein TPHA_0I01560 [Tetrapisispora phaffii CBS 4417]
MFIERVVSMSGRYGLNNKDAVTIEKITVLKDIVNTISGKDKIIKIIKNILDLIRVSLLTLTEKYRLSEALRDSILKRKLAYLIRNPILVLKYFILNLNLKNEKRLAFISSNLSLFRYILRFGSLPFQVPYFITIFKSLVKDNSLGNVRKIVCNQHFLSKAIEVYYTVCDELDLLYKLKFYSNATVYNKIVYHESLSWQLDIMLSLKNNFIQLKELKKQIVENEVELRIRTQAVELANGLPKRNHIKASGASNLIELENKVNGLCEQLKLTKLEMYKLIFDCLANTTDLFGIKTPRGTYNTLSLISGVLGFIKIWKTTENKLRLMRKKD